MKYLFKDHILKLDKYELNNGLKLEDINFNLIKNKNKNRSDEYFYYIHQNYLFYKDIFNPISYLINKYKEKQKPIYNLKVNNYNSFNYYKLIKVLYKNYYNLLNFIQKVNIYNLFNLYKKDPNILNIASRQEIKFNDACFYKENKLVHKYAYKLSYKVNKIIHKQVLILYNENKINLKHLNNNPKIKNKIFLNFQDNINNKKEEIINKYKYNIVNSFSYLGHHIKSNGKLDLELVHAPYMLQDLYHILNYLEKGGHSIIYAVSLFHPISLDILLILNNLFEEVNIKHESHYSYSFSLFIICRNYLGATKKFKDKVLNLIKEFKKKRK